MEIWISCFLDEAEGLAAWATFPAEAIVWGWEGAALLGRGFYCPVCHSTWDSQCFLLSGLFTN